MGLMDLVLAVEAGTEVAPVAMLAGGWLMQGRLASTQDFVDASYQGTYDDLATSDVARKLRTKGEERERIMRKATADTLRNFRMGHSSSITSLNLVGASAYMPGAQTVFVPAVRVVLSSITSWWVAPLTQGQPGPSSAAAFGAGALVGGLLGASDIF